MLSEPRLGGVPVLTLFSIVACVLAPGTLMICVVYLLKTFALAPVNTRVLSHFIYKLN